MKTRTLYITPKKRRTARAVKKRLKLSGEYDVPLFCIRIKKETDAGGLRLTETMMARYWIDEAPLKITTSIEEATWMTMPQALRKVLTLRTQYPRKRFMICDKSVLP